MARKFENFKNDPNFKKKNFKNGKKFLNFKTGKIQKFQKREEFQNGKNFENFKKAKISKWQQNQKFQKCQELSKLFPFKKYSNSN